MLPLVTVCIPAYNEENTIRRALESIAGQRLDDPLRLEILVGPNGCTDRTVDEVLSFGRETAVKVKVVDVDGKGKPTAWNTLIRSATADIVCFVDADVELGDGVISTFYRELEQDRKLALVAGKVAARMDDCSLLTRLSVPYSRNGLFVKPRQEYICGRLYAIRKSRLLSLMTGFGLEEMPRTVIHEDAWLQRMLDVVAAQVGDHDLRDVIGGSHRLWKVCPDAVVYFVPQDWKEDSLLKVRSLQAEEQLKTIFPGYHEASLNRARILQEDPATPGRVRRLSQILVERGPYGILRVLTARAMQKLAWRRARKIFGDSQNASLDIADGQWIRSEVSRS